MITAYMVMFSTLICVVVGIPIGVWSALDERRARTTLFWCDFFQTFPSFIYIIPVIMLFQVNDLSAIMAVIVYAIIPAVRYTVEGIRTVPPELNDGGAHGWLQHPASGSRTCCCRLPFRTSCWA